jgi:phosphotriesterase-related protein
VAKIRSVLGDIDASQLGPALSHEHVMIGWPGALLDPASIPDRERVATRVSRQLQELRETYGVTGLIDCTPPDLQRDVAFQAEVSRRSGIHIVAATGLYKQGVGIPWYFHQRDVDEIEDFFLREITHGVSDTGIRCGVIKVATDGATISPDEEKVLRAAARVSKRTGVAVTSHTDPQGWSVTNVGALQLQVLLDEGADPERCVIGHACGTTDLRHLLDLLGRGCFISYDRVGMTGIVSDELRAAMVAALVAAGYADRVMLSHDAVGWVQQRMPAVRAPRPAASGATATVERPSRALSDFSYIHREFLPLLRKGSVSDSAIHQMLVDAPRQAFGF